MPLDPKVKYHWSKHGSRLLEPSLQSGASIVYDGYGLMTFSGTYRIADNDQPFDLQTKNFPLQGEEIIKGSGLYISKVTKRYNADKTIMIDVEAIGIEKRCAGKTNICIEGMSACSNEPIETHPDFKTKIGGTPSRRLNGATFDKDGKFIGFSVTEQLNQNGTPTSNDNSAQDLAGVKSYLSPKLTYRGYFHCEWKVFNVTKDWINRMNGLHTKTGEIMGVKLLPDFVVQDTTGDFLCTSVTPENIVVDQSGNPVIVKLTYELIKASPVWNELIYINGAATRSSGG